MWIAFDLPINKDKKRQPGYFLEATRKTFSLENVQDTSLLENTHTHTQNKKQTENENPFIPNLWFAFLYSSAHMNM